MAGHRPAWRRRLSGLHQKTCALGRFCIAEDRPSPDELVVTLSGHVGLNELGELMEGLNGLLERHRPRRLTLDLNAVEYLDSAGALALTRLEAEAVQRGVAVQYRGLSPAAQGIKNLLDPAELAKPPLNPPDRRGNPLEQLGESAARVANDFYSVVSFLGDLLAAAARAAVHPRLIRVSEVLFYMEQVGVNGLFIVGLISFLLGLIMAFMSFLQLQSFGANIYVANLVALAMVKELGPMMTAVLVAGRSGSAFAAEIGTMRVNEEVDALVVMGYDPLVFLALPKVIAAVLTVPLLTIFADLLAIIGGLVVGVTGMGLTAQAYVNQTLNSINPKDIITSMIKSAVFAFLIAGIGCQRGFMVRGGAQAVGQATTSAVVAAMFLIIVADSIFAIVLHYY
ncbi:MAG: MlaE family lipid ABC transporter permease subunit [Thermodesulfobacteriota bacterium]